MKKQIEISLHILAWGLTFLAGFAVYIQFIDAATAFTRTFSNIAVLVLAFYINFYLFQHFFVTGKKNKYFIYSLLTFLLTLSIRILVNKWFTEFSAQETIAEKPAIYVSITTITTFIIFMISSLAANIQSKHRNEKIHLEKINQFQNTQLKFLKAQLNPHMLFNTINNIYALVLKKSDDAPEMLVKLSELLRYSIYQESQSTVDLEKELQHAEIYIELFKMRSKDPLPIQWQSEVSNLHIKLPPMILVSLIENAFKHGDILENKNAVCNFTLTANESQLKFTASNSYDSKKIKDKKSGIGLANISETLEILYPKKHILSNKTLKGIFEVELTLFYAL